MDQHSTNVPAAPEDDPIPAPAPYKVRLAPPRPKVVAKTFYQRIGGAFAYPFKKNGVKMLVVGTVIFGFFDFLVNFRMGGYHVLSLALGGLVLMVLTGYIFSYLQSIINSSALGDKEMPNWPEYESWWDSYGAPYVRLMAIVAACMSPALLVAMFIGVKAQALIIPLSILGFFYAPMALLAVTLDESLRGLNPLLCIPAIGRLPREYAVCCILFAALVSAIGFSLALIDRYVPQLAAQMLGMFFVLYFSIVLARLIGLLYFCKKKQFGWMR
jgi:hypothetical protein